MKETPTTDTNVQGRPAIELDDEELEHKAPRSTTLATGCSCLAAPSSSRGTPPARSSLKGSTYPGLRCLHGRAPGSGERPRGHGRGAPRVRERRDPPARKTLVELPDAASAPTDSPKIAFLKRIVENAGCHLHKFEAYQTAREVRLDSAAVARLYSTRPPRLAAQLQDRLITEAVGRISPGLSLSGQARQPRLLGAHPDRALRRRSGAAAPLVASDEADERYGLQPLVRVVATASVGVEPRVMGIGPAPAVEGLLARSPGHSADWRHRTQGGLRLASP